MGLSGATLGPALTPMEWAPPSRRDRHGRAEAFLCLLPLAAGRDETMTPGLTAGPAAFTATRPGQPKKGVVSAGRGARLGRLRRGHGTRGCCWLGPWLSGRGGRARPFEVGMVADRCWSGVREGLRGRRGAAPGGGRPARRGLRPDGQNARPTLPRAERWGGRGPTAEPWGGAWFARAEPREHQVGSPRPSLSSAAPPRRRL